MSEKELMKIVLREEERAALKRPIIDSAKIIVTCLKQLEFGISVPQNTAKMSAEFYRLRAFVEDLEEFEKQESMDS